MDCYNLKWNEYASTVVSSLTDAFNKKEFCDATIVCNGKHYAVHRLILSLGSNFFRNIFGKISCSESLIIIDGITNAHLEGILLFMYTGKVYINKDKTVSFLKAAKSLQVKGLYGYPTSSFSAGSEDDSIESYNIPLKLDNEMCDFPGFSSTKKQISSLPILKSKLEAIKDMEKSNKMHFQETKVFSHQIIDKVITRQSSRHPNNEFKNKVNKFYKNKVNYLTEKCQGDHLLRPIENYNDTWMLNVVNYGKKIVNSSKNIFCKANPFVPLERLTDSVISAANNGYEVHIGDKWNLDHNYSRKQCKETGMKKIKFDSSDLLSPMETKISCTLKGIKNMENSKENISASLRRLKQCAYCQFKTKSRISMTKHLRNHEVTEISSALNTNYDSFHQRKVKIFACNICSFKSESKMAVNEHQFLKHPDLKMQACKLCSFKCGVSSVMKRHLYLHEKKNLFKCSSCKFSSLKQSQILIHKKQCNIIGQVQYNNNANQYNSKIFPGTLNVSSCSSFNIKDNYNLCVDFENCGSFKCQYCTYTSTSKSAIKGHETFHSFDEEPFKCSICPYRSTIRALVKCHEMTHVV